jgi:hypothetical protein
VDHEPIFKDIQITTHLLNAYTTPFSSMVGGVANVNLGIIMAPMECVIVSTTPWVEPHNPASIPLVVHGTDPVDAAQLARLHDEFRRIHINRVTVYQALKFIVLEAFDNMYTSQHFNIQTAQRLKFWCASAPLTLSSILRSLLTTTTR